MLRYRRARLSHTRGYFVGDDLASAVTVYPFTMNVAGRSLAMGGLASVMSAPEYRRRGFVRTLILDSFERLRSAGVAWSLEYPFDPAYYARFGYVSVPNGLRLELPVSALYGGAPPDAERLRAHEVERLKPIHKAFAEGYNFSLTRADEARDAWSLLIKKPWEDREATVYLLEDAYTVLDFRYGEPNRLTVKDYAYRTPAGRERLLRFWGSFQGQAEVVALHVPGDEPLLFDYARYIKHPDTVLQARIVDVKLALEALPGGDNASFTLSVTDDIYDRQSYTVVTEDGRVSVTAFSGEPDLTLDAKTLALLLSGGLSAEAAFRYGRLEGDLSAAQALSSLAGKRLPFMAQADYF